MRQVEEVDSNCTSLQYHVLALTECPQSLLVQAALSRGSGGPSHWGREQGSKGCTTWRVGSLEAEQTASIYIGGREREERLAWLITDGVYYLKPDCCTVTVLSSLGVVAPPYWPGTSNHLPRHSKQKMKEPQSAVSPLFGFISVAY